MSFSFFYALRRACLPCRALCFERHAMPFCYARLRYFTSTCLHIATDDIAYASAFDGAHIYSTFAARAAIIVEAYV